MGTYTIKKRISFSFRFTFFIIVSSPMPVQLACLPTPLPRCCLFKVLKSCRGNVMVWTPVFYNLFGLLRALACVA